MEPQTVLKLEPFEFAFPSQVRKKVPKTCKRFFEKVIGYRGLIAGCSGSSGRCIFFKELWSPFRKRWLKMSCLVLSTWSIICFIFVLSLSPYFLCRNQRPCGLGNWESKGVLSILTTKELGRIRVKLFQRTCRNIQKQQSLYQCPSKTSKEGVDWGVLGISAS